MDKTILIMGMAFVTYLPRLLPFLIISDKNTSNTLETFLKLIPYTALGALIIPGVFTAVEAGPLAGLVGASLSVLVAWKINNLLITVVVSIAVTFLILLL